MKSLNVLIMGPAGAGKGTMSERIEKTYNIAHISTGDMFRTEMANNTQLGLQAKSYVEKGLLVPDELTIGMLLGRISQDDCSNGYLLDGFPRSLVQADVFDEKVVDTPNQINLVINLTVDHEVLINRIENRRICRNCGATYNLISLAPKQEGICDKCGGELYQRSDDNRESLKVRLNSYENETAPVIEHYRNLGIVVDVNATQEIDNVWKEVKGAIDTVVEELKKQEDISN